MDNSTNQAPTPAGVPPVQEPQVTNVSPEPAPQGGGGGKMIWVIVGLVLVILVMGGIYLYMNNKQAEPKKMESKPTSEGVTDLEKDLSSTSLDDLNREFSSVDTDLGSL